MLKIVTWDMVFFIMKKNCWLCIFFKKNMHLNACFSCLLDQIDIILIALKKIDKISCIELKRFNSLTKVEFCIVNIFSHVYCP